MDQSYLRGATGERSDALLPAAAESDSRLLFCLAVGGVSLARSLWTRTRALTSEIVNTCGRVVDICLNHTDYAILQYRLYDCVRLLTHHVGDRSLGG
jgi:hypothetical protein